ncbi:MAG: sigma-70 family RNA polymerase sigma factor [Clostridia bacterium]|nr:sigma-70 family RNA polymerase sigma factor [Clostridia bacterium]
MKYTDKKNDTETMSDEAIIELYWNRNEDAILATDDKYGRYLYALAYNIVRDDPDCEECLNDTYLSTWNRIPPTRPNVFQIFLSKITRNLAVDKYRKRSAAKRVPSELTLSLEELDECIPSETTVEDDYATKEIGDILYTYLRSLNKRSLMIFICRYYFADSIETIAVMLKISESTVYRELAAIRTGLKQRLEAGGYWRE